MTAFHTLWDVLLLFSDPLYIIALICVVEILKFAGLFRSLDRLMSRNNKYRKNEYDELEQYKRIAVMIIAAVLALVFYSANYSFREFNEESFRYLIMLFISYAIATTTYEFFAKYIFKGIKKLIKNLVE